MSHSICPLCSRLCAPDAEAFIKTITKEILADHKLFHMKIDNEKAYFQAKLESNSRDVVDSIINRPITFISSGSSLLKEEVIVYYKDVEISRASSQPDALRVAFDYLRSNGINPLSRELRIVVTQ